MGEKNWVVPTSVALKPSQKQALAELARQQNLSRSALVARWIEAAKSKKQQGGS